MKKRNTSIEAHFDTYRDYRTSKSYQQGYKNFRNQREKMITFERDLCVTHVTHHKETKIVFPRGVISGLDLKQVFDAKATGIRCRIKHKSFIDCVTYTNMDHQSHQMLVSYLTLLLNGNFTVKSRVN